MSRRRYAKRSRSRRRYYNDDYRYRRGGCLAPLFRLFQNIVTVLLFALAALILFFLVVLILFHLALFLQIITYAFFVGIVLAVLGLLYLIVRIITAISGRLSDASVARSEARMERERVQQARTQVHMQQAKLTREEYTFYDRYHRRHLAPLDGEVPVRLAQEGTVPLGTVQERRRATRNLALEGREEQPLPPVPRVTIPHIVHLLDNLVRAGQMKMLHGFLVKKDGAVEAVHGELPGMAIVAGKSRSGKTRRIMLMVFQALLMFQAWGRGYKITVCDPHSEKPDGLLKVLAPFLPWLHTARTNSDIVAAAREHIEEMESRLTPAGSRNGEGLMPRLLIIDEFPRLMQSELSKAEKRIIANAVRKSATQYQGVCGYAWIIGQEWTEDAIFDTALRKDAQAIFCHQLSAEYASFLFPLQTKIQRLVQEIARRECVFKDEDNQVLRIVTTTVTDEEIPLLVDYLTRYVIPRQVPRRQHHASSVQPLVRQQQREYPDQRMRQTQTPSHRREISPQQGAAVRRTRPLEPSPKTIVFPGATVLVPEEALPALSPDTQTVMPEATKEQAPSAEVPQDPFALLAELQRKKKSFPKI